MGEWVKKLWLLLGTAGVVLVVVAVAGAAPPANTSPPTISDTTPHVGDVLNGSDGVWDIDPVADTTTREWLAAGSVVGTGPSYTVQAVDQNKTLVFRVSITNADGGPVVAQSDPTSAVLGPLDHILVSPSDATIPSAGSQQYTAEGFDSSSQSLGDVTSSTTFTIGPDGSCTGAICTATALDAHTVTGNNGGKTDTASLNVTVGPLHHIVISPSSATPLAGVAQSYTAEGFDAAGHSRGDVTSSTTFTITPVGSCAGASCTGTSVGQHTVTGSSSDKTDTATLQVSPGPLDHLVLAPTSTSVQAGTQQAYTAQGFDQYGNLRGDVTASTTFTIAPDGSCTGASCTAPTVGSKTVTGTNATKTGTASLMITGVAPTNTAVPTLNQPNPTFVPGTSPALSVTSPGSWNATPAVILPYAYEWQRCTSTAPATCAAFGAANQASYALQQTDVGFAFRVKVTATNGVAPAGVAVSAVTALVTQAPFNNGTGGTVLPTITVPGDGVPDRGDTITGLSGTWSASPQPVLRHQWQRCNAAGTVCLNVGAPIVTAVTTTAAYQHSSSSTYVITDADLGSRIKLLVTAQIGSGAIVSGPTNVLTAQPARGGPVQIAGQVPTVTGTPARGQTLTASSGQWTGYWTTGEQPVAFTHQWQRCQVGGTGCVNVSADPPIAVPPSGATTCTSVAPCGGTSTYRLSDADMGSVIRVIVQAKNGGGTVSVTSGLTALIQGPPIIAQVNGAPDPNALPKINGNPEAGLNVGASSGSWSAFPAVDPATGYAYQWLRCSGADIGSCSPIGGATGLIYAVQGSDVGQRLRIRVTASNGVLPSGIANSDATPPVVANSGAGGSGVDLLLSVRASSSGGKLTYTLAATNAGDKGATGVTINATPPAGTRLVSASAAGGCSGSGPVACGLGGLAPGASGSATIVVEASATGVVQLSASVSSAETDVNTSNNSIKLSTFLIVVGSSPQGGTGTGTGTGVAGGSQTAGSTTSAKKVVALKDVKLKARRVGTTWVAKTTFTLLSGKADLRLIVTKGGSTDELTLLEGSRFGATAVEGSSDEVAFTATKSATFPIKIVLPARGFSLKQIYVIRITATAANGAASSLNIGFKGATLVTKRVSAKRVGKKVVATSTLALPAGASRVSAWVTLSSGVKKLILLKGSRLGTFVAGSVGSQLTLKTGKGGTIPVQILLAPGTVSRSKAYVIRVHAASANGVWADYELSFAGPSA